MSLQGFWGLHLLPGHKYTQKITVPFQILMAALADEIIVDTKSSLNIIVDDIEFVLCNLIPGKIEQQPLNVQFCEGEEITLFVKGKSTLHLTGNYIFNITPIGNSEDNADARRDISKEIHLDNVMDIPGNGKTDGKKSKTKGKKKDHDIEYINDSVSKSTIKAKRINENDDDKNTKKPKRSQKDKQPEQLEQNQNNPINIYDEDEPFLQQTPTTTKDSKGKRKSISINDPSISNNITQVTHDKIISPSPPPQTPNVIPLTDNLDNFDINSTSVMLLGTNSSDLSVTTRNSNDDDIDMDKKPQDKIKKLPNGLIVEDKKIGTGNSAKTGNRVGLRYLGKLTNGKTFDKNTNGKPFRFILGKGEVIRGWDIGITGMKIGGERRLTIPSKLAYGNRGMPPDIPPNSDLVFDVKMVDLK
ncbi:hypothetical protein BJ944DRAFT_195594 [Cunninghamella echinulata]|nr:hypothetical protein BJ944DRAFT_195594 [Cunninghamella echinulata]